MRKIYITKGLPGSGKTYWAKQYQKDNPDTVLVNKDDLRAMLHSGVYSRGREDFVCNIRDAIVIRALEQGHEVIVHDTNLAPKHEAQMRQIASMIPWKGQCEVIVKDFTDVPLDVCIKQDLQRTNSVGKDVIMQMYKQYLKPVPKKVDTDLALPTAILCDLDGTLALFPGKNPYERDFLADEVNNNVADILERYRDSSSVRIILVSGRKSEFRDQTESWLLNYGIPYDTLYMRKIADVRKDVVVKKEIYETEIKGKYNVLFVLDDRDQVVDLWRSEGLTCLQVAEGDF